MTTRINPNAVLLTGALIVSAVWLTRKTMAEGRAGEDSTRVRDAGPENMRYPPDDWDKTDSLVDESFPASDSPATY